MKSIDTYLCKEKKTVYEINLNIVIPTVNKRYTAWEIRDRATVHSVDKERRKPSVWVFASIVFVLYWLAIYKVLSL